MIQVDILLPYWGDPELFKLTVQSILAQTNPNWRLLIFDDCYPDKEAMEYIDSVADKRIQYHRHKKNIGITANFNYAIEKAAAEYCVIIGCDDIMLPSYIDRAISEIGEADFYQPAVDIIDKSGNKYLPLGDRIKHLLQPRKSGLYRGERLAVSLCHGNWLYFPSILWRTNTIKRFGFENKYKIVEDLLLEMEIILDGGTLYFDKYTTFQYRRFAESLSSKEKSKNGIRFTEEAMVYRELADKFQRMGWKRAQRAANLRITSRINQLLS